MKKVFFTAINISFFFLSTTIIAQEISSFGAFVATPVGDFKSTDLENGGFAEQGWGLVFDSELSIQGLPENLSIYFHSTYQWNKMNTAAIATAFTDFLGYRTTVSNSEYRPILTTVGPSYNFLLSEKLKLGVNGTIGIMFMNTKAFTVRVYDDSDMLLTTEVVNFDNRIAFAYTLGTNLKYDFVKDVFGIALFADYTAANQKTDLTFSIGDDATAFQRLQYFNFGLQLIFYKK
jgi:hypothetical protein